MSEGYSYHPIGTFVSKGGVEYHYPSAPNPRPHAPEWVGSSGNQYTYDGNGNLLTAEGRTYSYDIENRLIGVAGASLPTLAFAYDGDEVLRKTIQESAGRIMRGPGSSWGGAWGHNRDGGLALD